MRLFTTGRRRRHGPLAMYLRLLPYVLPEWRPLAAALLGMVGSTALTLYQPWPLKVIVDSVLGSRPSPAWISLGIPTHDKHVLLVVATVLMLFALALSQALALWETYFSELLGQSMVRRLRCDLFYRLQRLSLSFHDRSSSGDLVYRITEGAAALQNIVSYGFVPLAIQSVTAIVITGVIFVLDIRLGLIAVTIVPLLIVWTAWFSDRVRNRSTALANAERGLYTTAAEVMSSIRVVKSFTTEDAEMGRFEDRARSSQNAYVGVMAFSGIGGAVTQFLVGLGTAAVVLVGALLVLQHNLTVGELLVFIAYLSSLYAPITALASSALVIQRSAATIELVLEVLDEEDEHVRSGRLSLHNPSGRITYDAVTFGYDTRRPVAKDVSLQIEPGEMVAFVGRSGAGKTTLLSLLLRFYEPQSGRILIDGLDVRDLSLASLRQHVSLVQQEPIIFSGTIAENIGYGNLDSTLQEIVAASQAAGLDDFVRELPLGYQTPAGERGAFLSGGQRQRLSIARAFLKNAPILIMDEPTSSLDTITEEHIFRSLQRLARGKTTLVIAHRLATARRADRIVVLDHGTVVEQGPHEALIGAGGPYSELCQDQILQVPDLMSGEVSLDVGA